MALAALQTEFGSLIEYVIIRQWEPTQTLSKLTSGVPALPNPDAKEVIEEVMKLFVKEATHNCPYDVLFKDTRNLLLCYFTVYYLNPPMKSFLIGLVQQYGAISRIAESATGEVLEDMIRDKKCNVTRVLDIFLFIDSIQTLENIDLNTVMPNVFPLCVFLLDAYTHHILYSFQHDNALGPQTFPLVDILMEEVLKQFLCMYGMELESLAPFKRKFSRQVFTYSYIILFSDQMNFDLRTSASVLFIQSYAKIELESMILPVLVPQQGRSEGVPLEIPPEPVDRYYTLFDAVNSIYKDNEFMILVYKSILNATKEDALLVKETIKGQSLLTLLFGSIMRTALKAKSHNQLISEAARIIGHLTKLIFHVPASVFTGAFEHGWDYISKNFDHKIQSVREFSQFALVKFIEYSAAILRQHNDSAATEMLVRRMQEMTQGNKMVIDCFDNFSKFYGVHALLGNFDMIDILLRFIGELTVADVSCNTYMSIMERAFPNTAVQRVEWSKTWVVPVMKLLKTSGHKDVQNYCQKIFCAAFQLQPTMLKVIFPREYLGSTEESTCLLNCLNQARKRNLELQMSGSDANLYWRGLIDRKRMDTYMIHQDEGIRILVLACIVECQRTTEYFTDWEFVFLITYIRYNIPCEIPKIRKEMTELYKKAIKRFDAGRKVVNRRIAEANATARRTDMIYNKCSQSLKNVVEQLQSLEASNKSEDFMVETNPSDYTMIESQIKVLKAQYEVLNKQYSTCLGRLREQTARLNAAREVEKSYKRFITSFTKIMVGNLSFDSNYPRRAVSLELLYKLREILTGEEWQMCWSEEDIKNSHNVLFDSYESNKKLMVGLLKTLPPQFMGLMNRDFTQRYLHRSIDLAMSIRPSKTLAAAYLLEVCKLSPHFTELAEQEDPFPIINAEGEDDASQDQRVALIHVLLARLAQKEKEFTAKGPNYKFDTAIYGLIFAMRLQIENRDMSENPGKYVAVFNIISEITVEIAKVVMPVVCDPSPEGYLPDDSHHCSPRLDEFSIAQKTLVQAWRTIKEIMLLQAELIRQTILAEDHTEVLLCNNLLNAANFVLKVFYESKHRGVFEQAHTAFTIICESFIKSKNSAINILPKQWLNEATKIAAGRANRGISSTRRSAGLPFLILATLCAEMKKDMSCFQSTMQMLFKSVEKQTASAKVNEYKTHSMNVLRAIFRHSKLGEHVAPYVGQGVIASIKGFNTDAWGVRNSATLLFAALITRIFGVQRTTDSEELSIKNQLTVKLFISRYPELHEFLSKTLEEECVKDNSMVLHPVLMILSRLYPSKSEEYTDEIEKYLPFVNRCLASPVCQTRELAAKASVALLMKENVAPRLSHCVERISKREMNDTECHGHLLQIWYLLKAFKKNVELPYTDFVRSGLTIIENVGQGYSHITANLFLEIVASILYSNPHFNDLETLKTLLTLLQLDSDNNLDSVTWRSKYTQTKVILSTYIFVNKFTETDLTQPTVSSQILHFLISDDANMQRFSFYLLIALNNKLRMYLKLEPKVHPLIEMGEVEIPSEVQSLVNTFSLSSVKKILTSCHAGLKQFIQEEIKVMRYTSDNDRVLFFLLASYYPCSIRDLTWSKQRTLRTLLRYCDTSSEEVISAVIMCASAFVNDCDLRSLYYRQIVRVLERSASPQADVCRRMAVCEFMNRNYMLYCTKEPYLKKWELKMVLNILVVLLEDDELSVRNRMANFENNTKVRNILNTQGDHMMPYVPEKAREDAIILMTVLLPARDALNLLVSWGCRYFPDPDTCGDQVFERGELNLYAENTPLIDVCARMLIKSLWVHKDGLSFEDRSIFLEEKTLLVTISILDALNTTHASRIVLSSTRAAVINVFAGLYEFLETVPISNTGFYQIFKNEFQEQVLNYLTNHLEQCDMFSVKKLIRKLYDPVYKFMSDTNVRAGGSI